MDTWCCQMYLVFAFVVVTYDGLLTLHMSNGQEITKETFLGPTVQAENKQGNRQIFLLNKIKNEI